MFAIAGRGFVPDAVLHAVARNQQQQVVMSESITIGPDGSFSLPYNSLGEAPGPYTVIIGTSVADAMTAATDGGLAHTAFTIVEGGATPLLTIEPDHGSCAEPDPHVLARGQNFAPNMPIVLYVIPETTRGAVPGAEGVVDADGTFAIPVRLTSCDSTTPDGSSFLINAVREQGNVDPRGALASATFTVSLAAPPLPLLPTQPPEDAK